MNYLLVQGLHTSPYFKINGEPSGSIIKEWVSVPQSFKSMLKEFVLLGRGMIDMFHFTDFDH